MKDDDQLMYEAYVNSLMAEAPVGFGPSSDEPYEPEKPDTERLKKYSKGTLDDKSLHMIVSRVKEFLKDQPNGIFPGDSDDFKIQIKNIILDVSGEEDTALNINSTNAGYAARVVRNSLNTKGVIDVNAKEDKVEVQDVDDDDIEDAVETGLEAGVKAGDDKSPVAPEKFSRYTEYNVDPLAADTLPRQHKDIAEYVADHNGETGDEILDSLKTKMIFTNPTPAGGFDSSVPKLLTVLNDLVKAGVMIPIKQSEEKEGSGKHTDTFDATDSESQERADRDFIDRTVKQAHWGHETPVMRPDDF